MTGLIIFGSIILFFAFILSLKATISIEYNGEVALFVRVLFIKIKILPAKDKKRPRSMSAKQAQKIKNKLEAKKSKKQAKKAEKKKQKAEKKAAQKRGEIKKDKKTPGEILDILVLAAGLVKQVIGKFFGHLQIKLTRIKIKIGTGDAATTALAYGAISQAVNVFFPLLEGINTLSLPRKTEDIDIQADFAAEESEIDLKIAFAIRVWHVFHIAFAALGELIKYFFRSQKRKEEKK